MANPPPPSGPLFSTPAVREIHKNAFLKSSPPQAGGKKPQQQLYWTVFCVHDDMEPYLEFYPDPKAAAAHNPLYALSLKATLHVSPSLTTEPLFTILLPWGTFSLLARNSDQMTEWVESLQGKLREMRVLPPKDNLYSKPPKRDPNSPLPPAPEYDSLFPKEPFGFGGGGGPTTNLNQAPSSSQAQSHPFLHASMMVSPNSQFLQPLEGMMVENAPNVPLKEAQALRLKREMNHAAGVRVSLRKRDLIDSLCLVDFQGGVWIGGWKQKEHPVLYHALHVGDQLRMVGGVEVSNAMEALDSIRGSSTPQVELILRRLPFGRVYLLKRSHEGEPLGLVAEGSSAQISQVLEGGLAYRSGVRKGGYLTEINHRPISLFARGDSEVRERLNAVGINISILLQPTELVAQLKRGIKSMNRWKDYVVG